MTRRLLALAAAGLALALVVGLGYYGWRTYQRSQECDRIRAAVAERGTDALGQGDPRISVLGDSYAQGWELDDPHASWPASLPGTVFVHGFAGSGFTGSTYCAGESFAARAEQVEGDDADIVIVQGGLNDVAANSGTLRDTVARVLEATGADVLVGPPLAPQRRREDVERVDEAMSSAAAQEHVTYVSTISWDDLQFLDDGIHMTESSHSRFGERVAEALRAR